MEQEDSKYYANKNIKCSTFIPTSSRNIVIYIHADKFTKICTLNYFVF
jgi:hypothetical protein